MNRFLAAWQQLTGQAEVRVKKKPLSPAASAAHGDDDGARALRAVSRHLREIRGLVQQQADFTTEALHKAGWQSDVEAMQQRALHRALSLVPAGGDVIVGPWTGEVGFELLYWIPFLNWLAGQGLEPSRMVVISRGGAAPWYRHLTSRYVDILELVGPDEFREETAGPKKQMDRERDFDRRVVAAARQRLNLPESVPVLHPAAMFRLFAGVWRRRVSIDVVETFTHPRALTPPVPLTSDERPAGLPADYVLAKFYFSKAFPDSHTNRKRVAELLRKLSAQAPIALLSASVRLDEHADYQLPGSYGIFVIDPHGVPHRNLELQTRLVAGARGFVGTYGGFSYLAPLLGVRSLSFFSRRAGFEAHHLDLAHSVFDRLLPGGFLALDCNALDLVQPAIAHWLRSPAPAAPQTGAEPQAAAADALT